MKAMTEINREHEQAPNSDDLGRALDAALAKYAAVEARAGLEERILANLRAEQARAEPRAWWRWGFAAAATVLVIAAVLAWKTAWPAHPAIVNRPPMEVARPPKQAPGIAKGGGEMTTTHAPAVRKHTPKPNPVTVAATPKLDVFPSPRPLSEEELALAQYVRNFPTDAKLVAQAQAADEREVLAKMQALANESGESN